MTAPLCQTDVGRSNDPRLLAMSDVYGADGDAAELRDSLRRLVAVAGVPAPAEAAALPDTDRAALRRAGRAAGLSEDQLTQLVELGRASDDNVIAAVEVGPSFPPFPLPMCCWWRCCNICCVGCTGPQVFAVEGDFDDLVDSVKRIVGRLPQPVATVPPAQLKALSDLAAAGALSGARFATVLRLLRDGAADVTAAFDAFAASQDRAALAEALSAAAAATI